MRHAKIILLALALGPMAQAKDAVIAVPKAQIFTSHKDVYNTGSGEQVLVILHLPKDSGTAYVEVYNRTKVEISLFKFTLVALGHEGDLEFDDLPAGWSAVKEVKLSSLRELEFRNTKAFNVNADEVTPRLVIHHVNAISKIPKLGKHKV